MTSPPATAAPATSAVRALLAQVSRFADACAPRRVADRLRRIARYLVVQWPWTLVGLMYAFAWALPLSWSWTPWTAPGSLETFQLWVPLAAVIVGWGRREQVRAAWERAQRKRQMKRMNAVEAGNPLPLLIGCAGLLFVHLVQVKGFAALALIVIAWGVIYQAYGVRVTRTLALPLLLLLLVIPLPDSLVDKVRDMGRGLTLNALCGVLGKLHHPAVTDGTTVRFLSNNYVANMSPGGDVFLVRFGLDASLLAALMTLTYCLYKQRRGGTIAVSVTTAFVLGIVLNFARMLFVALTSEHFPTVASWFVSYSTYVFAMLICLLTIPLTRGIIAGFRRIFLAAPGGSRRRKSPFEVLLMRVGKIVALPFYPLLLLLGFAGKGAGRMGSVAKRSSNRTERALKSFNPVGRVLLFPFVLSARLFKGMERGLEKLMRRPLPFVRRGARNRNFRPPKRFE